ncbi:MAG: glycosyltransferase family 4 protein [Candidatus Nanopelagicales bacterium]
MRIVHVSDVYLPRLGGIEVQVRAIATAQRARGDEVTVITATPGSSTEDDGVAVVRLDAHLPFETPVHPRGVPLIREQLRRLQPDVVHIHAGVISPFAWTGIVAARDWPTVVTVHSMWSPLQQLAFRYALRREHRFVLTSVSTVAAQSVQKASAKPVLVTPNAIDAAPWRALEPVPHDDVHIVAALRFAPRKRAVQLMGVLREARRLMPAEARVRATIAGDGPLLSRARRILVDEGMDWVQLVGRVPRAELPRLYATADIFVQPTAAESFGLAALEARAAGLAVVGRSGSGLSEFVLDGLNGYLRADDKGMAEAIAKLVAEPVVLQRFREYNRMSPPMHSWGHALEALDIAYQAARNDRG